MNVGLKRRRWKILLTVQHYPQFGLEIAVSELPESKWLPRCALQQAEAYANCVLCRESNRVDISGDRRKHKASITDKLFSDGIHDIVQSDSNKDLIHVGVKVCTKIMFGWSLIQQEDKNDLTLCSVSAVCLCTGYRWEGCWRQKGQLPRPLLMSELVGLDQMLPSCQILTTHTTTFKRRI